MPLPLMGVEECWGGSSSSMMFKLLLAIGMLVVKDQLQESGPDL